MTCSRHDLDLPLITSHHIHSYLPTLGAHTFLLAFLLPPFIIINNNGITIIVPFDSSRGKIWKNPTGPRCASSPCPAFLTCLLPDHYSISSVKSREQGQRKKRQARPISWDQGAIRTWLPPVPDGGMEMKRWGGAAHG